MISYREKELLMVMKMLQEETEHTTSHMQSVLRSMNTKEKQISIINTDSRMCETYDELVDLAKQRGYDLYIRAEDVLTAEELKDLVTRKKDIESDLKESKIKRRRMFPIFSCSLTTCRIGDRPWISSAYILETESNQKISNRIKSNYE